MSPACAKPCGDGGGGVHLFKQQDLMIMAGVFVSSHHLSKGRSSHMYQIFRWLYPLTQHYYSISRNIPKKTIG